jgi:hypothetical protein
MLLPTYAEEYLLEHEKFGTGNMHVTAILDSRQNRFEVATK